MVLHGLLPGNKEGLATVAMAFQSDFVTDSSLSDAISFLTNLLGSV